MVQVTTQQLEQATPVERKSVAQRAVQAAQEPEEKKEVAAAAIDALSPDQRKELIQSMFPSESGHRLAIYMTGFIVAGLVAVLLALIAWQSAGGDNSVATSILVLGTSFVSAMLGGLLGAYVQRS
jgi:hypothetical protein